MSPDLNLCSCCNGDIAEIKNTKSCFWELLTAQEIKQRFLYTSQKAKGKTLIQKDSNLGCLFRSSPLAMTKKSVQQPASPTMNSFYKYGTLSIQNQLFKKRIPIQLEETAPRG